MQIIYIVLLTTDTIIHNICIVYCVNDVNFESVTKNVVIL